MLETLVSFIFFCLLSSYICKSGFVTVVNAVSNLCLLAVSAVVYVPTHPNSK